MSAVEVTGVLIVRTYARVEHNILATTAEFATQLQVYAVAMTTGEDQRIVVYAQGIGKESIAHWLLWI